MSAGRNRKLLSRIALLLLLLAPFCFAAGNLLPNVLALPTAFEPLPEPAGEIDPISEALIERVGPRARFVRQSLAVFRGSNPVLRTVLSPPLVRNRRGVVGRMSAAPLPLRC